MPTVAELAQQELSRRYSLQGRTQVAPRIQTMQNARPTVRSALSNLMRDAVDATGLEGGYRQGLLNAAGGVEAAVDFLPVVGDVLGLEDASRAYGQGDMVGAGINMMGVVPVVGDVAAKGARSALRVRPPSDNITNVRNANFQYPKTIGDETVNINSITGNLRVDQQEQNRINRLADQISSPEGYISRIIVDQNNNVIEGQHRLEALRQLGAKEVPVYKIEELADTMPVRKMEEAINTVGNIHSDHVNQIMQYALDNIAEEGVQGARNFDFGNFQKYYDAALNAVEDGESAFVGDVAAKGVKSALRGLDMNAEVANAKAAYDANPNNEELRRSYMALRRERDAMPAEEVTSPLSGSGTDAMMPRDIYDMDEDEYIKAINPQGSRIAPEARPNLGMGDMYGMAPRNAEEVMTQELPSGEIIRYVQDGDSVYALGYNPDLGEEDVIGYMLGGGDSSELAVVDQMQGQGIGGNLSYLYRSQNPMAQSGGFTEAGEAAARKTYRRIMGYE